MEETVVEVAKRVEAVEVEAVRAAAARAVAAMLAAVVARVVAWVVPAGKHGSDWIFLQTESYVQCWRCR